ncbi:4380_t:CDS:2, partial [Funneliformis geosporum]
MTRGNSLEQDLRLLINNPKYSDLEIICKDEKKLHGCRAILAARSIVFDRLLYSRVGENYEKQISLSKINSSGMEVIMEYVYTGIVKGESLTKENIVDAFIAADYFQLPDLQEFIMKTVKNTLEKNRNDNYSPELLSKILDTMPLTEDNILSNLLVDAISAIPLNTIEFGRLSSTALQVLLSFTHEKDKPFVTPEYELIDNFKKIDNELIPDHQKIAKEL